MSAPQNLVEEQLRDEISAQATADDKPLRGTVGYVRLITALAVGALAWTVPFMASIIVLLPARLDQLDAAHKVADFATVTVVGSIVALVANVVFGALSDRTRSRFGARSPWIVGGGVGLGLSLAALGAAPTFTVLLLVWCVLQLFLNMFLAPVSAIMADRVAPSRRGMAAGLAGTATIIGQATAAATGAAFIGHPSTGFLALAALPVIGGIVVVLTAPDTSNLDVPRAALTTKTFLETFTFPRKAADFYWALSGRFLLVIGYFLIMNYQLFILTDYIHLSDAEAARVVTLAGLVTVVVGIVAGLVTGPLSDRIGRRKLPVIASTGLIGAGALIPFLSAHSWAMLAFAGVGGFAMGMYGAVDQALVVEVLPNKATAAKDLGILNMANTGGQIVAPAIAAAVIAGAGGYRSLFLVCVIACALAAACIVPIKSAR
ncbi:MFS transporter [Streptomyces sp. NPDC059618]|uniref:MFS transporter n=1 Tax=Streptomyces sp. NPDC059618 TaxID=3346887 RepID=UPI0036CFE287